MAESKSQGEEGETSSRLSNHVQNFDEYRKKINSIEEIGDE